MKIFFLIISLLFISILSAQNRFDIVIDEIMSDPSPQVGLPNNEWIELKNVSSVPINLLGWRIGDSGGQSGPMPNFTLQPDSFVLVCTGSAVAALSSFGSVISVTGFPSLDNDDEQLSLKSWDNRVIHAVHYSSDWYNNAIKKDGGWTLEMIDTRNPCSGNSNWKACESPAGGTPGKINSVHAINSDQIAPQLINAYTPDNTTIILVFDEPVDSMNAATTSNYQISSGVTFSASEPLPPLFNQVRLKTNAALIENTIYTLTINNVTDCKGNMISANNKIRTGMAVEAVAGDIVVNEILFNPRPNGFDYVEFYNKSNKILDASKLYVGNRNMVGVIGTISQLSITPFNIFPGDYVVITENAANLAVNYLVKKPEAVLVRNALPTFPDDEGFVLLINQQGKMVDEVNYLDKWHFKLLDNPEGVSLERIDTENASQDAGNWHSAASTSGFGTPGYKNSQAKNSQMGLSTIDISPKIFSPDNDGFDDIAGIQYKIVAPGYVANVTIFDAAGRPVRNLVRNGTLSTNGVWNWDGLDDKGLKLPVGSYIIYTEIFNLQGKKDSFKNVVVLARKLD